MKPLNATIPPKKCIICGTSFQPHTKKSLCCSLECSKAHNIKRQSKKRQELNLGARLKLQGGVIGKINENIVAIDLLKRGFSVYIAYEDTHPFDLLALKNGKYTRVEVKTGIILPSGLRTASGKYKTKPENHDVLAVVYNLADIIYTPDIEHSNA